MAILELSGTARKVSGELLSNLALLQQGLQGLHAMLAALAACNLL